MDGATLRLLDRLREPGSPDAIEAFVMLVVGRTAVAPADAWWVGSIVDEAMQDAAAGDRAAPFRAAYAAARDLPIAGPRHAGSGSLALEGLLGLPLPQRVTLALSCILGFTPSEVASVIGFDPSQIRTLLEDGIATIRAAARAGTSWSAAS